jgi:AraC-like DNA-binding protein
MDFFDDLEFVCSGKSSTCSSAYAGHYFDGYYGLQFISSGKVQLKVDDSEILTARGPVCFFTAPGAAFSYNSLPGEFREHYFVCFRGARAERYKQGGLLPPRPSADFFQLNTSDKFLSDWKHLLRHLRQGGKFSHGEAVLRLEKILFEVAKSAHRGSNDSSKLDKTAELASRIADNPGFNWNFNEEADKLDISEIHLRRLFRKTTGMPLWRYVLDCRIRYASQLLLSTDKLVKEIACECGFNGVFHFSREFKKHMKKSPENFRKSI